jgi:hypothetical protein
MGRHYRFISQSAFINSIPISEILPLSNKGLSGSHKTAITLLATLIIAMPAVSADLNWAAGTGDWENDSNWSNGFGSIAPDVGDSVFVDNGGTAQVQTTDSVAESVVIGKVNNGALTISSGGELES